MGSGDWSLEDWLAWGNGCSGAGRSKSLADLRVEGMLIIWAPGNLTRPWKPGRGGKTNIRSSY